jgi:hypothetical protein
MDERYAHMRKFPLAPNHTPLKQRGSININDQIGFAWRITLNYDLQIREDISDDFKASIWIILKSLRTLTICG